MRLKTRQRAPSAQRKLLALALSIAFLLPLCGVAALSFVPAHEIAARAWASPETLRGKIERKVFRIIREQQSRMRSRPPTLVLDIKFKHLQKIRFDREASLGDRVRDVTTNSWVPASIGRDAERIRVKLRLKGSLHDHWDHPKKWSFRVKVKDGDTYDGMRGFSIQRPGTREFVHEWMFLKVLEEEGLIALKIRFLEVILNGDNLGLYVLVEQPGKEVIERSKFREGPLVGFDQVAWVELFRANELRTAGTYENSMIEVSADGSLIRGSDQEALSLKAVSLLEGFRRGELSTSEVFEVDQIARLAAVYARFGAPALDWRDMRYYYNPITSKIIPIGKENHHMSELFNPGWWQGHDDGIDQTRFIAHLFDDAEFTRAYLRDLDRMSQPNYMPDFLSRHAERIDELMVWIGEVAPWFPLKMSEFDATGLQIQAALHPIRPLHAHVRTIDAGGVELELANLHHFPIEVTALIIPELGTYPLPKPLRIAGKPSLDLPTYQLVRVGLPAEVTADPARLLKLSVQTRISGLRETREVPTVPRSHYVPGLVEEDLLRIQGDLADKPFLSVDPVTREVHCLPGRWELREPLIIPAGYDLQCRSGVHWDLLDGAFVLSHSPMHFIGTDEQPIVIESSDHSGQGIALISAAGKSVFEWVIMRHLSNPSHKGWIMTGAVSVYESEVRFSNVVFSDNHRGDDMLNIFRSTFVLEDSVFLRTLADAFDADFSQGVVRRVRMKQIGNDGLDTSGSQVEVDDLVVQTVGDKGLSFGEDSKASVKNVRIIGANIGIAAKDLSQVEIDNTEIRDGNIGLTVLQKKSEYGPAHIVARGLRLTGLQHDMLVEKGSTVFLDGQLVRGTLRDLKEDLYRQN